MKHPGPSQHKKVLWKLPILALAIAAVATVAFVLYKQQASRNSSRSNDTISATGWTAPEAVDEDTLKQQRQKSVEELENKAAHDPSDYKDFITLAQLYTALGNNQKALENYDKAKAAADPSMENYQAFIDSTNEIISNLKEESE